MNMCGLLDALPGQTVELSFNIYTELAVVSQRKSRTSSSFIFTSILLEVPKHLFPVLTNYVWFIMLLKNLLWSSGKCNYSEWKLDRKGKKSAPKMASVILVSLI